MSALWAPATGWKEATDSASRAVDRDGAAGPGSRLRAVPVRRTRLARMPFLTLLVAVFGLGMAGLLLLNTTLQNQAFEARALNRQATQLAYSQGELEVRLDTVSAPQELARRASALGMRANPVPALLVAPTGKVVGEARPVNGSEMPSLVVKSSQELAAEKAAAKARAEARAAKKAAAARAETERARRKAEQQAAEARSRAELNRAQQPAVPDRPRTGDSEGRR